MNAAIGEPATKRVMTRHSGPSELVTFRTFVSALVACRRKRFELCTAMRFSGVILSPIELRHATAYFAFFLTFMFLEFSVVCIVYG